MTTLVESNVLYSQSVYVAPTLEKSRNVAPKCDLCQTPNLKSYFRYTVVENTTYQYTCVGCFVGIHTEFGTVHATGSDLMKNSEVLDVLNYGNYYFPAMSHYANYLPNAQIKCLVCKTPDLPISIGCSSNDLCMSCFASLSKVAVKTGSNTTKPNTTKPVTNNAHPPLVNSKPAPKEDDEETEVFDLFS
jgi:hypothetical protein